MNTPFLKPCPGGGGTCPDLTTGGPCPAHARQREQSRGSATTRGYGVRWRAFRAWFIRKLITFGILPACGARWPGLPLTGDSRCAEEGRIVTDDLHLDHEPPLTEAEREDVRAVCDKDRVQLLCASCHSAKTLRERHAGAE